MDLLHREAQRSERTGEPLGVMMADIDHFKRINDSYGHQTGDAVLREVAQRLLASVRNYDYVGRYGGEEFLIVIGNSPSAALRVTAERMRVCISRHPIDTDAGPIAVTVSLGLVSEHAASAMKSEGFLRAADSALYSAKRNGRNRVESASGMDQSRAAAQIAALTKLEGVPSKLCLGGVLTEVLGKQ
jgi:two-component system cell cycle response regulator